MARKPDELTILEGGYFGTRINQETGDMEYVDTYGRTREQVLAEYQDRANRLNAVSGVYQLTNKIISRDSELTVTVVSDPNMQTNAMNDGRNIVFNANLIKDFDSENILHLHGLNFHELGHILFSPRAGSDLIRYIRENNYNRAITLLEEARSEALLVAKYPMTRLFLEASAMEYLVKDTDNDMGVHFPTITGRTYLPLEVRQAVADRFIAMYGAELANNLHSIIHEYRSLVFPRDFDKAKTLIARMADIVGRDNEQGRVQVSDNGHGSLNKGRPLGKAEQERLQDKIKKSDTPTESISSKSKDDSDGKEAGIGAGGEGTPKDKDKDLSEYKSLADYINKRVSEIKNDDYVKQQINETRKAILGQDEAKALINRAQYQELSPSARTSGISRRFGQELERIVRDNDPSWDKFNSRGKLNISRTMNPDINAIRTHFDLWDTGNPNTDIEAVILMDNSGSMSGLMREVTESAWIIKRGIESIEGSVTLFTFNGESKLVYDKTEKAKPNTMRYIHANGGTNPVRALIETERILTMSKKSIKLAFIVTDGEWGSSECNALIKSMNDKGFITCVVFIGNYESYIHIRDNARIEGADTQYWADRLKELKHGAQVFHAVTDGKDMLAVAQDLVRSMLKERKVA